MAIIKGNKIIRIRIISNTYQKEINIIKQIAIVIIFEQLNISKKVNNF